MSKMIKMTHDLIEECKREFEKAISDGKFADGKVTFTKNMGTVDRKTTVFFTEMAWMKMQTLIREFDKEVGWHGVATRNADNTFTITDILVYPQEVTGATVTTDQEKYQMWLMSHDDDVFDNIRMQGHSHVNMGTTPSTVDLSLYEQLLDQLDDDMFYIFMIWNKRGEKTIKIYDLRENILYETADITVELLEDGSGMTKFMTEAKSMVKDKVYTYQQNRNGTFGNYGGYSTPAAHAKNQSSDNEKKNDKPNGNTKNAQGKGRRIDSHPSIYGDEYDDDYGDYWSRRFGRSAY